METAVKSEKTYKVIKIYKGRKTEVERSLGGLKDYFSYTLEIGRSWDNKIKHPSEIKTIKSFISNLQKSYEVKESSCYERTYVELAQ